MEIKSSARNEKCQKWLMTDKYIGLCIPLISFKNIELFEAKTITLSYQCLQCMQIKTYNNYSIKDRGGNNGALWLKDFYIHVNETILTLSRQ